MSPTPQQLVPAPTAQGRAACLDAMSGRSRDGNGMEHRVISGSPVGIGSCYLMSPVISHSRQLSSLAPFCHSACHPKGKWTLGTPITPGWEGMVTSSLSCHSYGSTLVCCRDQFTVCVSQGTATGWSVALDHCMGWKNCYISAPLGPICTPTWIWEL